MLVLAEEIAATELEVATRLRHHPGYCQLLGLKGIGPVLGAIFIAEIGDITRFDTAAALCCWSGITPRHYESDKTVRRGHISKEGAKLVRWAAVESVQRSCEPAVKKVKDDILARRGVGARNVAKVAAARGCSKPSTTHFTMVKPGSSPPRSLLQWRRDRDEDFVPAGERHDPPVGAVEELNGPTTPDPRGSRRLHAALAREGMPGSPWLSSSATPSLKPNPQLNSRRRRQA